MSKVFYIKNWTEDYEVNASGRSAKEGEMLRKIPLDFIRLKVFGKKLDSGYRRLLEVAGKAKAMMVFGYFVKFLDLAGDEPRENRGGILRNERHEVASEEDLAFLLDLPIKQIRYAIGVLVNIGWMGIQNKEGGEIHADSLNSAGAAKISDASERNENEKNNLNNNETIKARGVLWKPDLSALSVSDSVPAEAAGISVSGSFSVSLNVQSFNFYNNLISIIVPRSQADRSGFHKISNWLKYKCEKHEFDLGIFSQVLQFASESLTARNPAAVFMSRLKKELDYDPKRFAERSI